MLDNLLIYFPSILTGLLLFTCIVSILDLVRQPENWIDRLLPLRERIQSPLGLVDVAMMFLLWAIGITAVTNICTGFAVEGPPRQAYVAGAQLLMTLFALKMFAIRYGPVHRIVGVVKEHFAADVKTGAKIFCLAVPPILLLQLVLTKFVVKYEHDTLTMIRNEAANGGLWVAWFGAVLVAPVCEEVFFRGVLQNWLQRVNLRRWFGGSKEESMEDAELLTGGYSKISGKPAEPGQNESSNRYPPKIVTVESLQKWGPIVITSLLFAYMHSGQGPAPIPLFFLSLVLGIVYYRTHSLTACIVVHMALNWFTILQVTWTILYPESAPETP